jgi:hypothetical protein
VSARRIDSCCVAEEAHEDDEGDASFDDGS